MQSKEYKIAAREAAYNWLKRIKYSYVKIKNVLDEDVFIHGRLLR